ncbi:MAG: TlpA family protein disulfide reductase [Clostridia bacterium]|nr:TlpA family protein disulfide reductase [Clostridia bacterium]
MKRIFLSLSLVIVLFALTCCTLDFSHEIDSSMDDLNNTIKDIAGDFIREDEKHSVTSDTSTDVNLDNIEVGTEVGQKCPSYSVLRFDKNGLSLKYINPTETGKVTVVNFWGTWCGYCINEMPYFDNAAEEYAGDVTFVAIHTDDYFSETAVDYVKSNYPDSKIIFAKDKNTTGGLDDCYTALGGVGYYPYTLILDKNGIITYKATGAISESKLIEEIEKALG